MADLAEWVIREQPTVWDLPRPIPMEPPAIDPSSALWFRMRAIYAPTYITDPRPLLKVTSV